VSQISHASRHLSSIRGVIQPGVLKIGAELHQEICAAQVRTPQISRRQASPLKIGATEIRAAQVAFLRLAD
jgi:hypothetical protein